MHIAHAAPLPTTVYLDKNMSCLVFTLFMCLRACALITQRSSRGAWQAGIESINRDVMKSFANLKLGMEILKQVLTQLLLYYTRFLDLVKQAYPNGAPFAQHIVSIPTLMKEIKNFSRSV